MNLVPYRRRSGGPLGHFPDEMTDLLVRLLGDPDLVRPGDSAYWPVMDISEDKESITVKAELPGMKTEDIGISVQGNALTIVGEKKEQSEEKKEGYYHCERRFGAFRRSLSLPGDIDHDKIEANYKDGVLTLTLPKTEAAKAKVVKVKS